MILGDLQYLLKEEGKKTTRYKEKRSNVAHQRTERRKESQVENKNDLNTNITACYKDPRTRNFIHQNDRTQITNRFCNTK